MRPQSTTEKTLLKSLNVKEEVMTNQTIEENVKMLTELSLRNDKTLTNLTLKIDGQFQSLDRRMSNIEKRFDGLESDIKDIKALLSK